jgi:serine/threonine protein kinase
MGNCCIKKRNNVKKHYKLVLKKRLFKGGDGITYVCKVVETDITPIHDINLLEPVPDNDVVCKSYKRTNSRERKILQCLNGSCSCCRKTDIQDNMVVKMYGYTDKIILLEKCDTDLFEWIYRNSITMSQFWSFTKKLINIVKYCHKRGFVHGDIKPENIGVIIDKTTGEIDLRLFDFGRSIKVMKDTEYSNSRLQNTRDYIPPECILKKYIKPNDLYNIDYWQIGVVCSILLTHEIPFANDNILVNCSNIVSKDVNWPEFVPDPCRDFVDKLLVKDPKERLNFDNINVEEYFQDIIPDIKNEFYY